MMRSLYALALAALLAAAFGAGPAAADSDCSAHDDYDYAILSSGECTGINRIRNSDATCMSASWPGYSVSKAGHPVSITNNCSDHGNIVAHIDLKSYQDSKVCVGSNTYDTVRVAAVRRVTCCFDGEGDLCWKDQVEANSEGKISRVTISGSTTSSKKHDVSTHWARYRFCQKYPNDVYCDVDPQGDANTEPEGPACAEDSSCNCGDHHCSADDCESEWNDNTPVSRGLFLDDGTSDGHGCAASDDADYGSRFSATIDAADGTSQSCTLQVVCGSGVTYTGMNATVLDVLEVTADVGDIDDLYNCSGRVKKTSCGTGTLVSTRVEEIYHTLPEGDGDGDDDDDDDDDSDDDDS